MNGNLLELAFLSAAQRRLFQRGRPVWAYHKIGSAPAQSIDPFLYSTADQFDFHLTRLAGAGYDFLSLDAFLSSAAEQGTRSTVVSFDDGFENVLRNGLEVLARHKAKAIQFLVAGALGGENHWDVAAGDTREAIMDAAGVRDWLAAGHDIGSHSMTHRNLKRLGPHELKSEILGSKQRLEDLFGVPIRHFAYPFGGYNPQVRDAVIQAGYTSACTMDFGVNDVSTPAAELRRIIPLTGSLVLRKVIHRVRRRFASTSVPRVTPASRSTTKPNLPRKP